MNMISIIIPVYNVEKYLADCIKSLLGQTYQNLEIILVDDGSTDKSAELCDSFASMDSRIRFVKQNNRGVSSARNKGLDIATGEYIAFVDPDDWCEKDMFEKLHSCFIKSDCDAAFCGFSMDSDLTHQSKIYGQNCEGRVSKEDAWLQMFVQDGYYTSIWNKMFRSDLIKKKNETIYFDEDIIMGEDEEWLSRVVENCETVYLKSKPLYHWMRHSIGACSTLLNSHTVTKQQIHGYKVAQNVREKLYRYKKIRPILNARYYNAAYGLAKNLYLDSKKKEAQNILKEIAEFRSDWFTVFSPSFKSKVKHLIQRCIIKYNFPNVMLLKIY